MYWVLSLLLSGCAPKLISAEPLPSTQPEICQQPAEGQIEIKQWRLPNDEKRKPLVREYLTIHQEGYETSDDLEKDIKMIPKIIVLHWTAGKTAKSTWNAFSSATISSRRHKKNQGYLNVGTQFLVDRDGTIYQLMDEDRVARHCIGLNHLSIGVENVGGIEGYPLTKKQVDANVALIKYLHAKYPITHVIGHYEYLSLEGTEYFSEKDPKYRSYKRDPGKSFMAKVRSQIAELNLQP